MKIELVYRNGTGGNSCKREFCGYIMTAENEAEEMQLNTIRNHYFWGELKYNGRRDSEISGNVLELGFRNNEIQMGKFETVFDIRRRENLFKQNS